MIIFFDSIALGAQMTSIDLYRDEMKKKTYPLK